MTTKMKDTGIRPDVMADMQAVTDALISGKPVDPEVARRVRQRAEEERQQLLATRGVQEIGVQIIREIRGDLP